MSGSVTEVKIKNDAIGREQRPEEESVESRNNVHIRPKE
jgi:hypothetical protein